MLCALTHFARLPFRSANVSRIAGRGKGLYPLDARSARRHFVRAKRARERLIRAHRQSGASSSLTVRLR
jgi:hypothetical protein